MSANNYYGYAGAGTYGAQYPAGTNQYATQQQYSTVTPGTTIAATTPAAAYQTDQSSYIIGGYARPVAQVATTPQQAYYSQQQTQQQSYQMTTAAKQMSAIGQRTPAPPPPTVYPSYTANTAGQTSYSGFTQATAQTAVAGAKFTAYAQGSTGGGGRGGGTGIGFRGRGGGNPMNKMKGPRPMPKPQTLHYCDVCKISCAGPQTYKEHLEGQKHKKKEAVMKAGTPPVAKGSPAGLRCELCDVTCTGSDAYAAHIRGAKHQKVFKLHTKLGKPIPSDNPTVVQPAGSATPTIGPQSTPPVQNVKANSGPFVKPAPPKINFIGPKTDIPFEQRFTSAALTSPTVVANSSTENSQLSTTYPVSAIGTVTPVVSTPAPPVQTNSSTLSPSSSDEKSCVDGYSEKEIQPVGQDYIEEIRTDDGKGISFNCKLCECRFNDPNAKEMHMKGRRHRLQYKKKVNPDLIVDVKPSSRQKKIDDRRSVRGGALRRGQMASDSFPRGPPPPLLQPAGSRGYGPPGFGQPNPLYYIPPLIRRVETNEDRHVMAKHAEIYPKEEELQAIQRIVSNTEKALKFVSDEIAEADAKKANGVTPSENEFGEPKEADPASEAAKLEAELQMHRILKGVMRVGNLAKGLLLREDRSVQLVVLCSVKPGLTLLHQITGALPKQLKIVAPDEDYDIKAAPEEAALRILSIKEPKIEVFVTLTSPTLRGSTVADGEATATTEKEPDDLLDKEKCLDALAALRHAKWFQARATALQSCVIVIRILRDLCQRVPAWSALQPWAVELITEKAVSSAGMPISPGEALRLVFEVISSGVILATGPGLLDPCEKESVDALATMSLQGREDVTSYAQLALRQIQFRQIHKILGIEPIPRFQKKSGFGSRKRRRNNSSGPDESDPASDGKKDKKESGEETMEADVESASVVKEEPLV